MAECWTRSPSGRRNVENEHRPGTEVPGNIRAPSGRDTSHIDKLRTSLISEAVSTESVDSTTVRTTGVDHALAGGVAHPRDPAVVGTFNIATYLPRMAATVPDQPAVIVATRGHGSRRPGLRRAGSIGRSLGNPGQCTFAELESASNRCANGLESAGIGRGDRVVVMARPGLEFTALIFALFKMGAVPVMIDPGMGMSRMVSCIARVAPRAFVGVPLAQVMRVLHRSAFPTLKIVITVGPRLGWGGASLRALCRGADDRYIMADTAAGETAAVLFTTGSTGPPKGAVYEHGMFHAQVRAIQRFYDIRPGEVDLPAFPLFALFSTAMGMTCVIPDLDPSRPGRADPAGIVAAIHDHGVTSAFGSPAIWRRVGRYCTERGDRLPTLRRILTAGAPVSWRVLDELRRALPSGADVHTPYGATESLPVSSVSASELLDGGLTARTRRGAGTCVGRPFPETLVRIIRISDGPIPTWTDDLTVPEGEHGEIVVAGPVVTREYFNDSAATALHKIVDGGRVWHRIGDVGTVDADGRLWFCGRKAHRVLCRVRQQTHPTIGPAQTTLFTEECEAIFNEHPDVYRTALVGVGSAGSQTPVLVVEPLPGRFPSRRRRPGFVDELRRLGAADDRTRDIEHVLFYRAFPVDIRHNAKIFREKLAAWAAERIR